MSRKTALFVLTLGFLTTLAFAEPSTPAPAAGTSAGPAAVSTPATPETPSAAASAVSAGTGSEEAPTTPAAETPPDPSLAPVEAPAFKTLFSPGPDAQSAVYEVKSGDTLSGIAKRHGATTGAIKLASGLSSDRIRPGQKLKVPTCKFSVVIDKSQNTLLLKGGETVLKTYRVSTGENNGTPTGVFKITDKLEHPVWYKEEKDGSSRKIPAGSPKNELGTRWLGLDKPGYGIHGTLAPEKLGTQCTQGCVRMRNAEVEELFEIVPPGTEVTIVD